MRTQKKKLKAQSSGATEVSDSSKELGKQIAQLMATLNRAEQGTCPASAPNSPRHRGHGRGRMDRNAPVCPSSPQWSDWPGPKHFHLQFFCCRQGNPLLHKEREVPKHQQVCRAMPKIQKTPALCNVSGASAGGYMARECATPAKPLIRDGGI